MLTAVYPSPFLINFLLSLQDSDPSHPIRRHQYKTLQSLDWNKIRKPISAQTSLDRDVWFSALCFTGLLLESLLNLGIKVHT
ncbi:hypothetical protein M413DRAFT_396882 [Hebeloma cylindrosporum]|uniref:Uncharacterized protein n=1 Tax=Hebeloma cylindrosporum TaxID=76867 RepID=A0A0C2XZX9_HEBCY|nr:hypothetical protein M413DRAFT_396882 [Hebeloma cylindrosporum h7]